MQDLIRSGAFINICNRYNRSPFEMASDQLKESILELAKSENYDLNRLPFREDLVSRLSASSKCAIKSKLILN